MISLKCVSAEIGDGDDAALGELVGAQLVPDPYVRARFRVLRVLRVGLRVGGEFVGDEVVERALLFDDAQDRTQLAQVVELGLVEQVLRAGGGDLGLAGLTRRGERRADRIANLRAHMELRADGINVR